MQNVGNFYSNFFFLLKLGKLEDLGNKSIRTTPVANQYLEIKYFKKLI